MARRMTLEGSMTQAVGQATTPAAPPAPASRAELKQQIKEQILDATQAAQEAAQEAAQVSSDAKIAGQRAGRSVIMVPPPPGYDSNNIIPPQAVDIAIGFFIMCAVMVVGWPLARAFGRRIERRPELPAENPAMAQQLQRIEQAIDAMSIEIERISESQRFVAKLQSGGERDALPADRG